MREREVQKTVLIFRDTILPISETFIKAQAEALTRYAPLYCGLYPSSPSLVLPQQAALLQSDLGWSCSLWLKLYQRLRWSGGFRRRIGDKSIALIHAHFAPDGLSALSLARSLRVPLIVTLHGYDVTRREEPPKNYQPLWDRASLFLCVSSFIRQCALERGFPAHKLRVQPIGINEQIFQSEPGAATKNVLFVGRLVEKKGCAYLLQAMQRVQNVDPEARLIVIGEGPLRESLMKSALALGITATFLGAQNSDVIRGWMRDAAVFCVPSTKARDGDSEGLGMVFLEAQAMGVPVVSFLHGGIPEAVVDGSTGLLAAEGDVGGLADRILCYLENDDKRRTAGIAGRLFVQRHFSLHSRTKELEEIYDAVLAGSAF